MNSQYSTKPLAVCNNKLYVWSKWWIFSYGNKIPLLPKVWNKEILIDTNGVYFPNCFSSIYWSIYYAHTWDNENFISAARDDKRNRCPYWYLVTNPILWDNLSSDKSLNKLKIGFKNVKSTRGNIKIYARVDDNYFWTFTVTGVTVTPAIGSIYTVATNTTVEVLRTDIVAWSWTITARLVSADLLPETVGVNYSAVTKVSGTGDALIAATNTTNMILVKTIESDSYTYGEELIFGQSFIDAYMPNRHKLQLVIELNSNNQIISPEVYDISILSDIVNQDV
jgi:hypothetical protein